MCFVSCGEGGEDANGTCLTHAREGGNEFAAGGDDAEEELGSACDAHALGLDGLRCLADASMWRHEGPATSSQQPRVGLTAIGARTPEAMRALLHT